MQYNFMNVKVMTKGMTEIGLHYFVLVYSS